MVLGIATETLDLDSQEWGPAREEPGSAWAEREMEASKRAKMVEIRFIPIESFLSKFREKILLLQLAGQNLTQQIKSKALDLGFFSCGISRATFLEAEARQLEAFLEEGRQGAMGYLENHFDKRTDPRLLVEGTQSILTVLHPYFPQPGWGQPEGAPKISKYAWGQDYHKVLKSKLYRLLEWIQEQNPAVEGRVFVDSAPVMDKAWARRSGLGWIGKHTNLIVPQAGSWFFIGEILLNIPLEADGPIRDHCGTCTRCIEACPTQALAPYEIDARRCISYLTIELKEKTPAEFRDQLGGWAYGCDVCQEVCPWNSFSLPAPGKEFEPLYPIARFSRKDWETVDEKTFKKLTRYSAMSRIRYSKWLDNLEAAGKKEIEQGQEGSFGEFENPA